MDPFNSSRQNEEDIFAILNDKPARGGAEDDGADLDEREFLNDYGEGLEMARRDGEGLEMARRDGESQTSTECDDDSQTGGPPPSGEVYLLSL